MRRIVTITFILIWSINSVQSQSFYKRGIERKFLVTGVTGLSSYFGELTNPGEYFDTKLNFGGGIEYRIVDRFALRSDVRWFRIGGSDIESDPNLENRGTRNLSFRSDNFELAAMGVIYLYPEGGKYTQRPPVNAYFMGGVGLLWFNPKAELNGNWHALRPLQTEGVEYSRFAVTFPVGLGMTMKVNRDFDIAVEGGYRFAKTDYLDDISTVYQAPADYISDLARALGDRGPEIGRNPRGAGGIRGNPDRDDGYFLIGVKVGYYVPTSFFGMKNKGSRMNMQGKSKSKSLGGGTYKYKKPKKRRY